MRVRRQPRTSAVSPVREAHFRIGDRGYVWDDGLITMGGGCALGTVRGPGSEAEPRLPAEAPSTRAGRRR